MLARKDYDVLGTEVISGKANFSYECAFHSSYYDYGMPAPTVEYDSKFLHEVTDYHNKRFYFFVREEAWQWAVKNYPVALKCLDSPWHDVRERAKTCESTKTIYADLLEKYSLHQWHIELQSVLDAFRECCKNPMAAYWSTGQWYGGYPGTAVQGLAKLTLRIAKRQLKELKEQMENEK